MFYQYFEFKWTSYFIVSCKYALQLKDGLKLFSNSPVYEFLNKQISQRTSTVQPGITPPASFLPTPDTFTRGHSKHSDKFGLNCCIPQLDAFLQQKPRH